MALDKNLSDNGRKLAEGGNNFRNFKNDLMKMFGHTKKKKYSSPPLVKW